MPPRDDVAIYVSAATCRPRSPQGKSPPVRPAMRRVSCDLPPQLPQAARPCPTPPVPTLRAGASLPPPLPGLWERPAPAPRFGRSLGPQPLPPVLRRVLAVKPLLQREFFVACSAGNEPVFGHGPPDTGKDANNSRIVAVARFFQHAAHFAAVVKSGKSAFRRHTGGGKMPAPEVRICLNFAAPVPALPGKGRPLLLMQPYRKIQTGLRLFPAHAQIPAIRGKGVHIVPVRLVLLRQLQPVGPRIRSLAGTFPGCALRSLPVSAEQRSPGLFGSGSSGSGNSGQNNGGAPATGDDINAGLWIVLLVLGAALCTVAIVMDPKIRNRKK